MDYDLNSFSSALLSDSYFATDLGCIHYNYTEEDCISNNGNWLSLSSEATQCLGTVGCQEEADVDPNHVHNIWQTKKNSTECGLAEGDWTSFFPWKQVRILYITQAKWHRETGEEGLLDH